MLLCSCLLYGTLIAWGAQAAEFKKGDMLLRGRVVVVDPSTEGTLIPIGGDPYISTATIPEIDFSYFLTDHIAAEFIPGLIPHKAKAKGTALGDRDAGHIYAVAPTVILQYHWPIERYNIKPYLGLGMAYVKYFEDDKIDQLQYKDDFAAIVQAGMDIPINDKWVANIDVKKVWAGTEVKINRGAASGTVEFNPFIYGVGL